MSAQENVQLLMRLQNSVSASVQGEGDSERCIDVP
jgi:hypothetical protein